MRVLLIQPPMYHQKVQLSPNLGLASIAAVLEQDGVGVGVLDAAAEDLSYDDIIERIRAFS
ncbi:MAG: B12-binding domain-containing radical SAM protein, partial [Proteobacteria bacterium]|nr:B12-binding domain-containing radical SAM protein [Pseudomonadota bacterium]